MIECSEREAQSEGRERKDKSDVLYRLLSFVCESPGAERGTVINFLRKKWVAISTSGGALNSVNAGAATVNNLQISRSLYIRPIQMQNGSGEPLTLPREAHFVYIIKSRFSMCVWDRARIEIRRLSCAREFHSFMNIYSGCLLNLFLFRQILELQRNQF